MKVSINPKLVPALKFSVLALLPFVWASCSQQKPHINIAIQRDIPLEFSVKQDTIVNIFDFSKSPTLTIEIGNGDLLRSSLFSLDLLYYHEDSNYLKSNGKMYTDSVLKSIRQRQVVFSALTKDSCVYFIAKDSLYKISIPQKTLSFLANLSTYTSSESAIYEPYTNIFGYSPALAVINDSILFAPIQSLTRNTNKLIGEYNLKSQTLEVLPIRYPEFYTKTYLSLQNHFSLEHVDSCIHISFSQNPLIIEYNYLSKKATHFMCKSKYDTLSPLKFKRKSDNVEKIMKTVIYDGNYRSFVYNTHKNHFYYLYQIGQPEFYSKPLRNTFEDRRLSFMILNTDFEIISETLLPASVFSSIRIFPTSYGAYLFSPLPESQNSKPNILKTKMIYE